LRSLFSKEQKVLDDALNHLDEIRNGLPANAVHFKTLTNEYALFLEQQQQILEISDKASIGLLNEQKTRKEQIAELKNELFQSQISIMLSQIQPHFIFNSLTAIKGLCLTNPEMASEAVDEFSSYLRGNLDSLLINKPVQFERELRHVQTYLSLEKKRFGDKLCIICDIKADCFLIPALTLQPIVENAVRHGIIKREEGGTITIRTDETETEAIITVIDDGVGFDANSQKNNERIYVGIENVRSRLFAMCGGTLNIHSELDTGTTAVISIPKAGNVSWT